MTKEDETEMFGLQEEILVSKKGYNNSDKRKNTAQ